MALPLEGIRIIDMSGVWATPGAARNLADQGADVIKVETQHGDEGRRLLTQPAINGESRAFWMHNRNKRSIVLDLKHREGLAVLHRLVAQADVLLHNFRPGVDKRLGFDYDACRAENPRLIYGAFSAWGERGPLAQERGYDMLIQAQAGTLGLRREPDGTPIASGVWFTDLSASMNVAYAITLALFQRERTGVGQRISGSLMQTALALQTTDLVRVLGMQEEPPAQDMALQSLFRPYRCQDGVFVQVVVVSQGEWELLAGALGHEEWTTDARFRTIDDRLRHSDALKALIAEAMATRSAAEWNAVFRERDVPAMPVISQREVFDSEQAHANEMFVEIDQPDVGRVQMVGLPFILSGAEGYRFRPSPALGQHTDEILAEAGYDAAAIAALRGAGAVS
jgi:crotonobetainyl-CoA:carnitine CoA-transferase CaiB-like acyl-CoA transferase